MEKILPTIKVSLFTNKIIQLKLSGYYFFGETQRRITGEWRVYVNDSKLFLENDIEILVADSYTVLEPSEFEKTKFVVLNNNTHSEKHFYKGSVELHQNNGKVTILNDVGVDQFIQSVLCVHFYRNQSVEFLKVQAVLLRNSLMLIKKKMDALSKTSSDSHVAKFYSELHTTSNLSNFLDYKTSELLGLYHGMPQKCNQLSHQAVAETEGFVMQYNGELCAAPQNVCCGGITESDFVSEYSDVKPHIKCLLDSNESIDFDLREQDDMRKWYYDPKPCYCDVDDKYIVDQLSKKDSDYELFRWDIDVCDTFLSKLLSEQMGIDIGLISNIYPLERGTSGAIKQLRIEGTSGEVLLNGQLLIKLRETLQIKSLAFFIEKTKNKRNGITFSIKGSGMGYAAGVCQIGAIHLANKGQTMEEILDHYFSDVAINKVY